MLVSGLEKDIDVPIAIHVRRQHGRDASGLASDHLSTPKGFTPVTPASALSRRRMPLTLRRSCHGRPSDSSDDNRARQELTGRLPEGKNAAVVGPAGMGKTTLAAAALEDVVGPEAAGLHDRPFPDGIVCLPLYRFRGEPEAVWASRTPTRPPGRSLRAKTGPHASGRSRRVAGVACWS